MEEYFVEEKTSYDKLLDFLVFVAVFVVTIFLLLELFSASKLIGLKVSSINSVYFYVNIVVFVIFAADLVRLWKESEGAEDFFKTNWLDVLATIPFGIFGSIFSSYTVLNALKWSRLLRLSSLGKIEKASRISKISKEFKAAAHLKKEGDDYKKKHRL